MEDKDAVIDNMIPKMTRSIWWAPLPGIVTIMILEKFTSPDGAIIFYAICGLGTLVLALGYSQRKLGFISCYLFSTITMVTPSVIDIICCSAQKNTNFIHHLFVTGLNPFIVLMLVGYTFLLAFTGWFLWPRILRIG